jgi:hypothetical protein
MATYRFKDGPAYPAQFGDAGGVFKRRVDTPAIIADSNILTDTSGNAAALAATGWAAADILQVFRVPQGFLLYTVGVFVVTVEDSVNTMDIGIITAAQNNWASGASTNLMNTLTGTTAGAQLGLVGDTLGGTTYMSTLFITDGQISITFNNASDTIIFDVWAVGWNVKMAGKTW